MVVLFCQVRDAEVSGAVQNALEVAKQTQTVQQLSAMQDNLTIELARLKSPRRIAKIAREQLGLISPSAKQTIVMP